MFGAKGKYHICRQKPTSAIKKQPKATKYAKVGNCHGSDE